MRISGKNNRGYSKMSSLYYFDLNSNYAKAFTCNANELFKLAALFL